MTSDRLNCYCMSGDLAGLQLFCALECVAAVQVRRAWALQVACSSGHLDVAQWLHRMYRLTADDARALGGFALKTRAPRTERVF